MLVSAAFVVLDSLPLQACLRRDESVAFSVVYWAT